MWSWVIDLLRVVWKLKVVKEVFPNCQLERHILREALTFVHICVCERVENPYWFKQHFCLQQHIHSAPAIFQLGWTVRLGALTGPLALSKPMYDGKCLMYNESFSTATKKYKNGEEGWFQFSSCSPEISLQKSWRSQRIDLLWRIVRGDSKSIYWSEKFVGGSARTCGWGGLS